MSHHHVAVGEHPLDVELEVWVFASQPVDEAGERLGSVGGGRVVLDVAVTEMVCDGLLRIAVERRLVVVHNNLLVALQVIHDLKPHSRRHSPSMISPGPAAMPWIRSQSVAGVRRRTWTTVGVSPGPGGHQAYVTQVTWNIGHNGNRPIAETCTNPSRTDVKSPLRRRRPIVCVPLSIRDRRRPRMPLGTIGPKSAV